MGCGGSKPPPQLYKEGEVQRPGVPARIEIPTGNAAWRACTIGKALDTTVANAFDMRVDNGGPNIKVVLKRPEALNTFAVFSEYMENGGGDDFDEFRKTLPTHAGQPIRTVLLAESRTVDCKICENRQYNGGERVLVLHAERLVDATVGAPPLNGGSHHALMVESGPSKGRKIFADLNEFNHCLQLFPSVDEYEAARTAYLEELVDKLAHIQDAITGNRLNVDDQVRVCCRKSSSPSFLIHCHFPHPVPGLHP